MAVTPIEIATPFKRYPKFGRCLYCGRKGVELKTEHIIPFGLASDSLVLPKSTCERCRRTTHDYETKILRHMWWPFRHRLGAPSRNKEPPEHFVMQHGKVTNVREDGSLDIERLQTFKLPPAEYPLFYYAFVFKPPGILTGKTPKADEYEGFCLVSKTEMKKYVADGEGFRAGPSHIYPFVAMIAKIAHGYASAELGAETFVPFLTKYIRGFPDEAFRYVGGAPEVLPNGEALHEIGLYGETINGRKYAMVRLRLFAMLGTPEYRVVVGELHPDFHESSRLEKPLYTIDMKPPVPVWDLVPAETGPGLPGPR